MLTRTHGVLHVAVAVDELFGENTLLLATDDATASWVVDPGLPPATDDIIAALDAERRRPAAIVITHGHGDHIAGIPVLRERFGPVPIWVPRAEAPLLTSAEANLSAAFGVGLVVPPANRLLDPGDVLQLGALEFTVLDVSGHSPGGVAFYCAAAGVVISGDALFAGSIGRTDFPGSDQARLLGNLRASLLTLPDETVVYPGHGPTTTIGQERRRNPYLMGEAE
jgi:glyoxylase-like metal-dependent hydrolase (beta-lactamase superfamily II)